MGQAIITAQVWFGNSALPDGQGTLAWLNLADFASWFPQDYEIDGGNRLIGAAGQPYRARRVYVSDDFDGKSITIPSKYYEGPGVALGAAKAQLSQAGEQWLSLDNKLTATLVKLKGFGTPKRLRKFTPYWWNLPQMEFYAKEPWFQDVATTTPAGFPIAQTGSVAPGDTVTTAIVYAGSVKTQAVFTLNIPASNTVVINQFVIKNAMTGETLVITFTPSLAANVAWTITIDCAAGTVVDQTGAFHDHQGSFPQLAGPAGTSQNILTTLITNTFATSGETVGCTFKNKWEL